MSLELTRELLQTTPVVGMPGWEKRRFLITYPGGADGSGHSHPVPGIGYVLEGTMVSAFDDAISRIVCSENQTAMPAERPSSGRSMASASSA